MDEGPQLRQRYKKKNSDPGDLIPRESIDERISPSLVTKSVGKQQPVVFGSFVLSAFTRWFGLNRYRVQMPWTAYVAQHGGQSPAFDTAVLSINTMFLSHRHQNRALQQSSREAYTKALRLFSGRICDANMMKSTESVGITIILSLFEAYSRTNPDSWAHHASGTALLMEHRGPKAHLVGFDRCLYLSFRSFLVAEAFLRGRRCLFELPEWQAHIDQIRVEDMSTPKVDGPISLFIDLQDRIFKEVVKVPGLLVRARELHASDDPIQSRNSLSSQAYRISQALHTLSAHLRTAAASQSYEWCRGNGHSTAINQNEQSFIGPIPTTFPQEFANSVLRGVDQCQFILCLLLDYIEKESQGVSQIQPSNRSNSIDRLPFRFVSKLASYQGPEDGAATGADGAEQCLPSPDKWLDLVAASMGLEAFDIVITG
ncbi:Uncharacterized protein PECH_007798 [Penicillium ucsense]|uniref:Transcription factor domain-containing protein n=1 Tax=Penicillium ucsense TaxID=2839758 RepID=A0A8J8W2C2_9EURO|nr:Uncharacterized protein PECM_007682 [Penicillium ucsense]KAF7734614.1 Uncharacterized protein PECH_007798 [Penicillium ucsense]